MGIIAQITGTEETAAKLVSKSSAVRDAIAKALEASAIELVAHIKKNKLSGQVLKRKTGNLSRSINYEMNTSGDTVSASVGSNAVYAAIHEFGGQTAAHAIHAKAGSVLAFQKGGSQMFAKSVNHPGSKMPQRSFLRSALADKAESIRARLDKAVKEVK